MIMETTAITGRTGATAPIPSTGGACTGKAVEQKEGWHAKDI
jgi:hypothetical protein